MSAFKPKAMPVAVRIVIFAKAPLPGIAKTRLVPALGMLGAAALAKRMLLHSIDKAIEARPSSVELCVSPRGHPIWDELPIPKCVTITDQGEGDLGQRMAAACARTLGEGEAVLLIGTDCPACDAAYLQVMLVAMASHDAVVAAAVDGGYPALGLTRFDPSVFEGIAWSTSSVLQETLARFKALMWHFKVFPELHDIDEPQDLIHLPEAWKSSERPQS
jgi:uncharacterized protein